MHQKVKNDSAAKFDRIRRAHQSEVAEDYVEMIADLTAETGEARTVDLAARFGVTSPTVNAIVQRLQRENLVETRPYRSIFLTAAGQALADKARDRHRIVRDFLVTIGVPEAIAEEDANIVDMLNKSRGDFAYTLIDVEEKISQTIIENIKQVEGILKVRAI